jgi:hypothetical protein
MKSTDLAILEKFAVIIATISYGIPGTEPEITTDEIAEEILYRGRPVNLIHQCETVLRIIEEDNEDLFEEISPEQKEELWSVLISLILQSGMLDFFPVLDKFRALVEPQVKLNFGVASHRFLFARIVLFGGRIAGVSRQFLVGRKFGRSMKYGEFGVAKSQIVFILMIARPLWRVMALMVPHVKESFEQLEENLEEWKLIAAKGN